ncbi:MAG TPA: hypothetical protein VK279_04055 [Solirubrobacteraceae bacterium]|nr:hypothetical protein [Solirubrobacteraceae bacterium]
MSASSGERSFDPMPPPGGGFPTQGGSMTVSSAEVPRRRTDAPENEGSSGWVTFAGVMILIAATVNIIGGIAAIDNSTFYTQDARFVVSDSLNTWGWFILLIGVVEILVALAIWAGSQVGRWTGVLIASVNAIAQLFFISASPFWSLGVLLIDMLVIYGLTAHGGRGRASLT